MGVKSTAFIGMCIVLAACGHARQPAPVYDLKLAGRSTGTAIVAPGDSLATLAKRYAITLEDIIRINGGADALRPGQRLSLPAPKTYTVRKGDGVVSIAHTFDVRPEALVRENNLVNPLHVGQVLRIPSQDIAAPRETIVAQAPALPHGNGMFAPPVRGKIISSYGPKSGGLYNDGINIAAPAGTTVHAADAGTVVYAGNGLQGYGNLILIKHDNGYFTVYSHLADKRVAKGTLVKRGATIGTVGASGKVDIPQLHFEVRRGTKSLDPAAYL